MHPYYGEIHLHKAVPTPLEVIPEASGLLSTAAMNGQHPHLSYLHNLQQTNGIPDNATPTGFSLTHGIHSYSPGASAIPSGIGHMVEPVHVSTPTGGMMTAMPTMTGYLNTSYSYPMPPLSTSPTLLFRSPVLFTSTMSSSGTF